MLRDMHRQDMHRLIKQTAEFERGIQQEHIAGAEHERFAILRDRHSPATDNLKPEMVFAAARAIPDRGRVGSATQLKTRDSDLPRPTYHAAPRSKRQIRAPHDLADRFHSNEEDVHDRHWYG